MKKIFGILLLFSTFYLSLCFNSGIKIGLDTEILKILKQIDLNKYIANKTLVKEKEFAGKILIVDYDIKISNLYIASITGSLEIETSTTLNAGTPVVHVTIKDVAVSLFTDFYIKVAFFKKNAESLNIQIAVKTLQFDFYFKDDGQLVISKLKLELEDLNIAFTSMIFKLIYKVTKKVIMKAVELFVFPLKGVISNAVNDLVNKELLLDIGLGIGANFTITQAPSLIPYERNLRSQAAHYFIQLSKYFNVENKAQQKKIGTSINTSFLTVGLHGSVYPNLFPDLQPNLPEAVDMKYLTELFDNEVQILLSDYTVNTILYMIQQTGYLHKEYKASQSFFPYTFTTQGLKEIIPEFGTKYDTQNYEVEMNVYIKIGKNAQPLLYLKEDKSKVVINYGIEFLTITSQEPFDDPVTDLKLNLTAEIDMNLEVVDNELNISVENFQVTEFVKLIDELKIEEKKFKEVLVGVFNDIIAPYLNDLTLGLEVLEVLEELVGIQLRDLKIVPKESYIALSVGVQEVF